MCGASGANGGRGSSGAQVSSGASHVAGCACGAGTGGVAVLSMDLSTGIRGEKRTGPPMNGGLNGAALGEGGQEEGSGGRGDGGAGGGDDPRSLSTAAVVGVAHGWRSPWY